MATGKAVAPVRNATENGEGEETSSNRDLPRALSEKLVEETALDVDAELIVGPEQLARDIGRHAGGSENLYRAKRILSMVSPLPASSAWRPWRWIAL